MYYAVSDSYTFVRYLPMLLPPTVDLVFAHGDIFVGLCDHQNRDDYAVQTEDFSEDEDENHSYI